MKDPARGLIIFTFLLLLAVTILWLEIIPYPVLKTTRVTQHPISNYPLWKYSYDVSILGFPLIAETREPVLCSRFDSYGKMKFVRLGDGRGSLKENYSGIHLIIDKFTCK